MIGTFKVSKQNVADWTAGKTQVRFRMGLYNDRSNPVDWLLIDMLYDPTKPIKDVLSCTDGYSDMKEQNKVTEDDRINCFLDYKGSKLETADDTADLQATFIRPFYTDDRT